MINSTLSFKRPDADLVSLEHLSLRYPNVASAFAEIARLSAVQTLPLGAIHVISDIHGEEKKLQHVINNASGTLRPLVERLFSDSMSGCELKEFLKLVFYPAEITAKLETSLIDEGELREYAQRTLDSQFLLFRHLMANYSLRLATQLFPAEYKDLLMEILHAPSTTRGGDFIDAIVDQLIAGEQVFTFIHLLGRLIRNLAVDEIVIGGDCWDRGPRGDRVVDYLRQQPNLSFIWGNHDVLWLGAALGNEALICNVLRISLRYRRLSQLDEGYSIPLTPLEHLVNSVYTEDAASFFVPKGTGMRPMLLVARMQKAIAVMQFKLEGQLIERNPEWHLEHRRLLHQIDFERETIRIDGEEYALRDAHFPTIDPADPYSLREEEELCLGYLKQSFLRSQKLQEQMRFMVDHGAMYLNRRDCLIFHGCVPADEEGNFRPMPFEGQELAGKALFEHIEESVRRAFEKAETKDLDLLWYLWCGPLSPLFGKDRIATFERYFIEDKASHKENKDPYFNLIHGVPFCDRVLEEFEMDTASGLIVNGHVPVKIEAGESPLKDSGKAITIDGAFSEAYGDYGYTLLLEPDSIVLAEHHHFESVDSALRDGVDIVPEKRTIRSYDKVRTVRDGERGQRIRYRIDELNRLVQAYRTNRLHENPSSKSLGAL